LKNEVRRSLTSFCNEMRIAESTDENRPSDHSAQNLSAIFRQQL
jgi:hypothetical protein